MPHDGQISSEGRKRWPGGGEHVRSRRSVVDRPESQNVARASMLGVVTLLVTHLPKLANSGRQWPNSLVHETPDFIGILSPADIG